MAFTKVFQSGNSQAVRLPKEFKFNSKEIEIFRRGNEVILRERQAEATDIFDLLTQLPDDFMSEDRQDAPPEQRENW
jgi:antitoxin VapB